MADLLVELLDVGDEQYSDSVLIRYQDSVVLIDGAHQGDDKDLPGRANIPGQLEKVLGPPPHRIDLLVVSHAHDDHIGCLPELVATSGLLDVQDALVIDPDLGWGRPASGTDAVAGASSAVRRLVAALREEARSRAMTPDALERWMADGPTLESRYTQMLTTLRQRGTTVVRYVQDTDAEVMALLDRHEALGLRILGPTQLHMLLAAEAISKETKVITDALALADASGIDPVDLYRRITGPMSDAGAGIADSVKRLGAAVNNQSLVLRFGPEKQRALVGGDMQFAKPEVGALSSEMTRLRQVIRDAGPYQFAKLSHHGSHNAVDGAWLDALGTPTVVGISSGHDSPSHPDREVLDELTARKPGLRWVRTDRNHHSTVRIGEPPAAPEIEVDEGDPNDATPPAGDVPGALVTRSPGVTPTFSGVQGAQLGGPSVQELPGPGTRDHDPVEVLIRLPPGSPKVAVTVELGPTTGGGVQRRPGVVTLPADARTYPRLLYVTAPGRLAANVGQSEAAAILDRLRSRPGEVVELPDGAPVATAVATVRERIAVAQPEGVVLIGGYDVVPAQRADALPGDIRSRLVLVDDADDFIVWTDDGYGDTDDDVLPELPVSRVPDGRSATFLAGAIAPQGAAGTTARGLRNVYRQFADGVHATLPQAGLMKVSQPTVYDSPGLDINGDRVYLMLHGDFVDATRFWGEDTDADREAMNVANVRSVPGATILAGACWGGLIVNRPAAQVKSADGFETRLPGASIALSFLQAGALAFVGCTGSHYSPLDPPFGYYGGPLHQSFWANVVNGDPPARALFRAKTDYAARIPHGPSSDVSIAIELKIWRQFTCLGLGW
jgi:beta-lactamase superfamily II metal-dependent hydrolase